MSEPLCLISSSSGQGSASRSHAFHTYVSFNNATSNSLRQIVVELLQAGAAHLPLGDALSGLRPEWRTHRPPGLHSIWQLVEHIRITQEDILRYTLDADWHSPTWPEGYWPDNPSELPEGVWQDAYLRYERDLQELVALAQNPTYNLAAEIPHGDGQTYLRQLLLVADHCAYHTGQIVSLRRTLGDWPRR